MHKFLGINDNQGGSFKEYFKTNNMPDKIFNLKQGLNLQSCILIDKCIDRILNFPTIKFSHVFYVELDLFLKTFETEEEHLLRTIYEFEKSGYCSMFNLANDAYNPDTFLFHHGLRFQNKKIKQYIEGKDFIDAGAYIGDSALVLNQFYNPKQIFSFELSKITSRKYLEIMNINNIDESRFVLINKGVSDVSSILYFDDSSDQGSSLCYEGKEKVETISIDDFASTQDINIGFIKSDVEGFGLKALQGMKNSIVRHRPVLSLSIYHNPEEFFEIKPALEQIIMNSDYEIKILHCHPFCDFLADVVIFAYPKELADPIDADDMLSNIRMHPVGKKLVNIFNQ